MKRFVVLIIAGFVCATTIQSQAQIYIKGKVSDKETGNSLPSATVSVPGFDLGTVTNSKGQFELNIPAGLLKEKLAVSFIGYKPAVYDISDFKNGESLLIPLEISAQLLEETVISAKRVPSLRKILDRVLKNIPINYPQTSYSLSQFYRAWEIDGDTCKKLNEADITVYDPVAYVKVQRAKRRKVAVRVNEIRNSLDGTHFQKINYPIDKEFCSADNWLRRLEYIFDKNEREKFQVKLVNITSFDEQIVYKISFRTTKTGAYSDLKGVVYVNEKDYAVVKLEFSYLPVSQHFYIDEDQNDHSYRVKSKSEEKVVFKKYRSHYLPAYQSKKTMIYYYPIKDSFDEKTTELRFELLTSKVNYEPGTVEENARGEIRNMKYNPDFWKNYTTISYTPEERKMLKVLKEKKASADFKLENR